MNQQQNNKIVEKLNQDQIIALMDVYLNEWMHRDELLWTQVFKFFYANLVVIVLPNIAEFIGIVLPEINKKAFPIIGIFMAIIFLYVGIGYTMRLRASSRTYVKIMHLLGDKRYERISIKNKDEIKFGCFFALPMAIVLIIAMFVALIFISIMLMIIN